MEGSIPTAPGLLRRVGNLRALADLPGTLARLHRSGPPVARLDVGSCPIAYLRAPDSARALLDGRIEGVAERGRFYREISRVIGSSSLVTCEGEQHRRLRRLVAPAFRPERVAGYGETMLEVVGELVGSWEEGDQLVVGEAMSRLTLEIAARALLGLDHAEQLEDFAAVLATGSRLLYRLVLPARIADLLWRNPLSPANRRLRSAQRRVDGFVAALLASRASVRPAATTGDATGDARPGPAATAPGGPAPGRGEGRPANLLDVLLEARDEPGSPLGDEELRDQVVTFLFAGHETTAQALTWAFVQLSRHPEAEERLCEELRHVLGRRAPEVGDLARLTYARAVVRETLRLCPPAWFLSREASEATVIDGCPVPKGTLLLSSPLGLHRDAAFWSEPLRFDPDRWLEGGLDPGPPSAYVPFGYGRRNCVGSTFALTELVLVLAAIVRRWRLRVVDPEEVRERPTVTLRTRSPVRAVLEPRPA